MVMAYAENIFGLGQEMLGRLAENSSGISHLRVGSVSTLSRNYQENWIKPVLTKSNILLTLESGRLEDLLSRLMQHQLDVVLSNKNIPTDPHRSLVCRFLDSQSICLVGPSSKWHSKVLRIPHDLDGLEIALPGPRNAFRSEFDALCATAEVNPKIRAEVEDMAMLRLIARDSGWLTLLPEVVVQDELQAGELVVVGESQVLKEHFYAITTPHHYPLEVLEKLLSTKE
jgi:LysR family transcriptional activator of nhaA